MDNLRLPSTLQGGWRVATGIFEGSADSVLVAQGMASLSPNISSQPSWTISFDAGVPIEHRFMFIFDRITGSIDVYNRNANDKHPWVSVTRPSFDGAVVETGPGGARELGAHFALEVEKLLAPAKLEHALSFEPLYIERDGAHEYVAKWRAGVKLDSVRPFLMAVGGEQFRVRVDIARGLVVRADKIVHGRVAETNRLVRVSTE